MDNKTNQVVTDISGDNSARDRGLGHLREFLLNRDETEGEGYSRCPV